MQVRGVPPTHGLRGVGACPASGWGIGGVTLLEERGYPSGAQDPWTFTGAAFGGLDKTVRSVGNSGGVLFVPKKWVGKKVKILLLKTWWKLNEGDYFLPLDIIVKIQRYRMDPDFSVCQDNNHGRGDSRFSHLSFCVLQLPCGFCNRLSYY